MLAYQDAPALRVFAVYLRPEGERGTISFYPDEQSATAEVGPGMPAGVITHGDVYVEYIGNVLLFAPESWPMTEVDQDLLVNVTTDDGELFIALTPAESAALLAVAGSAAEPPTATSVPATVAAPKGESGITPCATWSADGKLAVYESGFDSEGVVLPETAPRSEFGEEVAADRAVVVLLDAGFVPLVEDEYTWRELGDVWVLNIQPRIAGSTETFLARYLVEEQTLIVSRIADDTNGEEAHLQVVSGDVPDDFIDVGQELVNAGWRIDSDSKVVAHLSANAKLRQSPGWYPAEPTEDIATPTSPDGVGEWVCVVTRAH